MKTRDNIWDSGPPAPGQTSWQRLSTATLPVEVIRQIDQRAISQYHMSSLVLMENAALGCVNWLAQRFPAGARTVILCGCGNNGGDGLVIARHLRLLGWSAAVIQLGPVDKLSHDARANWDILNARSSHDCQVIESHTGADEQVTDLFNSAGLIIDAMLGSGARGQPQSPLAGWIEAANASSATRVAIDIPTGLDATTGQPATPTFRAAATLTFVARKPGFAKPQALAYLGQVHVLPIGIPVELIDEILLSVGS